MLPQVAPSSSATAKKSVIVTPKSPHHEFVTESACHYTFRSKLLLPAQQTQFAAICSKLLRVRQCQQRSPSPSRKSQFVTCSLQWRLATRQFAPSCRLRRNKIAPSCFKFVSDSKEVLPCRSKVSSPQVRLRVSLPGQSSLKVPALDATKSVRRKLPQVAPSSSLTATESVLAAKKNSSPQVRHRINSPQHEFVATQVRPNLPPSTQQSQFVTSCSKLLQVRQQKQRGPPPLQQSQQVASSARSHFAKTKSARSRRPRRNKVSSSQS